ncbi:MAG TPA: peroxiredoxin-like family protein [Cytophagales bacterium]|nr:peroxiredoxin-like family protein [Cytophagales bacterium]
MESSNALVELNVTAPTFSLKDIYGNTIDLSSYRGKKVFIGFFRHAGCPFCNLRVHALSKAREEFRAHQLEMIFFFESASQVLLNSIFHKDISPVPIISDPQKIMYATYGIESSTAKSLKSHLTSFIQTAIKAKFAKVPMHLMSGGESINTMPAEFLLDENLIIRKLHYAQSLNDYLSFDVMRAFVKKDVRS